MELRFLYFKVSQLEIFIKLLMHFCHEDLFLYMQTVQTLMKFRMMRHFIYVFTICQITCLQVSRMKIAGEATPLLVWIRPTTEICVDPNQLALT